MAVTFNFRLQSDKVLKLSDFGMTQFLGKAKYYEVIDKSLQPPMKWMSPESLTKLRFNYKSEVVSICQTISGSFCVSWAKLKLSL